MSLTNSLIHSLSCHSLTHSLFTTLLHSLTHLLTYPLTRLPPLCITHPLTHTDIVSPIDSLTYEGEAFRPSLATLANNSKSLRNIYGPTETTIWASSFLVPRDVNSLGFQNGMPVVPIGKQSISLSFHSCMHAFILSFIHSCMHSFIHSFIRVSLLSFSHIGMPIANIDFYVVQITDDEDNKQTQSSSSTGGPRLVGEGEEGELWIGGIGVSLGYLNQPDLTQKVHS